jgi:hypothetical protein
VAQRNKKKKVYSLDEEHITPVLNEIDKHIEKYEERLKSCGVLKGKSADR